jgi:hypothetical protein
MVNFNGGSTGTSYDRKLLLLTRSDICTKILFFAFSTFSNRSATWKKSHRTLNIHVHSFALQESTLERRMMPGHDRGVWCPLDHLV